MKRKIGLYIDTGYGIGEALDIEALEGVANDEFGPAVCKSGVYWSDPENLAIIRNDIASEELTSVVIAGPSPRVHQDLFRFDGVVTERINLREHVIWSHPANDEDTQMLAEDYIRMGLTKADKYDDRAPFEEATDKSVLVIGGGATGISAALSAANAGYQVYLIEKEAELGGWANKFHKSFDGKPPYDSLVDSPLKDKIQSVNSHDRIKVYTSHRVYTIMGAPGMFDAIVRPDGPWIDEYNHQANRWKADQEAKLARAAGKAQEKKDDDEGEVKAWGTGELNLDFEHEKLRVGSVVVAAGWRPDDPTQYENLGYGKYADVITNVTMEELAKNGKITRPSDGKEVESIAFLECNYEGIENPFLYNSYVTSLVALKQAQYLRQANPNGKAYVFYENMRTIGQFEKFYQTMQNDPGVFLSAGKVIEVTNTGPQLTVELKDTHLAEHMKVKVDMVVLSVGMIPVTEDSPVVNLRYRQGPYLPKNPYGFNDSHFICFPYETQRTGVYTAGCVRQPVDFNAAEVDGAGAALKAIQCAELVSKGMAVHPRAGDQSYPELHITRCTQCKRCTDECPFGAYDEKPDGTPLPNPTRCRRCGICMGSCPERIISFRDHSVDMIGSMIKSIHVPDEYDEKPRAIVFVCENDAYPVIDMAGINRHEYSPYVRFIPLRCLGNINLIWIADALSKGIDGIMLIGCKYGDDYQCHFVKGSELAEIRMSKISETLQRLALESERIEVHQLAIDEAHKLPGIVNAFMDTLAEFDPNPYKGF